MNRFRLTRQAEDDVEQIWHYIAQDNFAAADNLIDTFFKQYQMLAERPLIGRERKELLPELRSFPVGRYVIFYRAFEEGIEVIRVLSGYRDLESLFESG